MRWQKRARNRKTQPGIVMRSLRILLLLLFTVPWCAVVIVESPIRRLRTLLHLPVEICWATCQIGDRMFIFACPRPSSSRLLSASGDQMSLFVAIIYLPCSSISATEPPSGTPLLLLYFQLCVLGQFCLTRCVLAHHIRYRLLPLLLSFRILYFCCLLCRPPAPLLCLLFFLPILCSALCPCRVSSVRSST